MYASYGARWRARVDHSPRATRRQPLRSFYISEHELQHLAVIARVPSLSLCVSVSRRVSSSRRSFLVSAGTQRLISAGILLSLSPLSSLVCSRLSSALLSFLHCSRLYSSICSASVSFLPRLRLSLVVSDF